jgi:glycosyltransferase involved in cell wall biosynthesis
VPTPRGTVTILGEVSSEPPLQLGRYSLAARVIRSRAGHVSKPQGASSRYAASKRLYRLRALTPQPSQLQPASPKIGMPPVRVVIDGMQLKYGHGAARTLCNILPYLADVQTGLEPLVLTTAAGRDTLGPAAVEILTVPDMPSSLWEQAGLPWYSLKVRAKALYSHRSCGPAAGPPTLVHFLDDPLEAARRGATKTTPKEVIKRLYQALAIRLTLSHARVVAAFTEASATALRQRFGPLIHRLEVIPLGVDTTKFYPAPHPREDVIFHLGSAEPRDQTALVLKAYSQASHASPDLPDLAIGGDLGHFQAALQALTHSLGVHRRVHYLGHIRDERALREMYSRAAFCVQPSLYESFGLSNLEALACGAPLIVLKDAAVQEVCDEAAIVIDRPCASDLAAAISNLWSDTQTRQQLRLLGPQRASRFPWTRTAGCVAAALRELASGVP